MSVRSVLFDGRAWRDFLYGFLFLAALLTAFGLGVEVGAASAGETVAPVDLVPMLTGGLVSVLGIVYLRFDR